MRKPSVPEYPSTFLDPLSHCRKMQVDDDNFPRWWLQLLVFPHLITFTTLPQLIWPSVPSSSPVRARAAQLYALCRRLLEVCATQLGRHHEIDFSVLPSVPSFLCGCVKIMQLFPAFTKYASKKLNFSITSVEICFLEVLEVSWC